MKKIILIILVYFVQLSNLNTNEPKLEEIIRNLNNPWSLSFVTDKDILISEKSGSLLKIDLTTSLLRTVDGSILFP